VTRKVNAVAAVVEAGIIDPTEVVRFASANAVFAAGVLLLTEATMTEVPEPKAGAESPSLEAA
jgi:chaperonin GroEL